jgi:kinesin family protein 2/24
MNTYNDVMMKEYSSNNINTNQNNSDSIPKIRVVVRKRPLNKREISKNEMDIIDIRNGNSVIVKELK